MQKLTKSVVVAAGATCMGVSSALADGIYQPPGLKDPIPPPIVETWTGAYFGLGIGVGFMDPNMTAHGSRQGDIGNCAAPGNCSTFTPQVGLRRSQNGSIDGLGDAGGLGTIQLGYDFQMSNAFVGGLFVDVDWNADYKSKFSNSSNGSLTFGGGVLNAPISSHTLTGSVKSDYSFSVGGRLGFLATPRTLIYGLAAYTMMDIDATVAYAANDPLNGIVAGVNRPTSLSAKMTDQLHGITIGGGIETKLARNWSAKFEYRYTNFDDQKASAALNRFNEYAPGGVPAGQARRIQDQLNSSMDMETHSVRAVVSYRFN